MTAVWEPDLILAVRLLINDTTEPYKFTDDEISDVLTAVEGDTDLAAGKLWRVLAARYHTMTDVTEAGSSRKNSLIFEHALKMAQIYDPVDDTPVDDVPAPSRTNSITRV